MYRMFILALVLGFQARGQHEVLGRWLAQDKDGIVEIYQQNGKYYGKIVWLKNPLDSKGKPQADELNPDKKLQSRPVMNLMVLKDFVYKNKEWTGGTIYDPKSGNTYSCTMWLDNGNLRIRGYWGFFYRTETWTKSK